MLKEALLAANDHFVNVKVEQMKRPNTPACFEFVFPVYEATLVEYAFTNTENLGSQKPCMSLKENFHCAQLPLGTAHTEQCLVMLAYE